MNERRPRDYDPFALERMPDQPPRDLDVKASGRWVLPEVLQISRRAAGPGSLKAAQLARSVLLRAPGDYYAYLNQGGMDRRGWQGWAGVLDVSLDPNRYGFYSRAQELYPQSYKAINTVYWRSMSDEERNALMARQAAAQERVGFERNTHKFFIGDVQVDGLPGPGEEPSATELLTEFDTEYTLRRKAYHQRMREREEIRLGKRKRYNQYTATRDEANCPLLGLPSVVEGIKDTPALKSLLPGAAALHAQMTAEIARSLEFSKPAADSPGLKRLRTNFKPPPSYRELRYKNETGPAALVRPAGAALHSLGRRQTQIARNFSRQAVQLGTRNKYGLVSRSELSYPSAYATVAPEVWAGLTEAGRSRNYLTQAIAQEKAGFEKGAPKFFIDDFDPAKSRAPSVREQLDAAPGAAGGPTAVVNVIGGLLAIPAAVALLVYWQLGGLTDNVIVALTCAGVTGVALMLVRDKPLR